MSGIEVAGLVLGAIPIVISGIEYYIEGIETLKSFRQFESGLKNILRALDNEHALLVNACGLLLNGSSLHPDRIAPLLNDGPANGSWKDLEVEDIVRAQLCEAFHNFKETLEKIHDTVEELREKLGINPDQNVRPVDTVAWKRTFARIKFGFRRKHYDVLVQTIHNETFVVERLVRGAQRVQRPRTIRRRADENLRLIRCCARSVYQLICSSWRCTCQNLHTANLYLNGQSSKGQQTPRATTPCFRVAFCFEERAGHTNVGSLVTWRRAETDIRLIEASQTSSKPLIQLQQNQPPHHAATGAQPSQVNPTVVSTWSKLRHKVRFPETHSVDASSLVLTGSAVISTAQTSVGLSASPSVEQIEDFCKLIASLREQPRSDLGLLVDPQTNLKHGVYAIEAQVPEGTATSLTTMLSQMSQESSRVKKRFNLISRIRLGVILASSIVRLGQTPWLSDNWSTDDILFIDEQSKSLQQPFVSKRLTGKAKTSHCRRAFGNEALFTLGILLIELWFGTTLEVVCKDAGLSPLFPESKAGLQGTETLGREAPDRDVIEALVDCLEADGCTRYADVVSRCLLCTFDCRKATLEEDDFLQAVYTGVVSSLEETEADLVRIFGP